MTDTVQPAISPIANLCDPQAAPEVSAMSEERFGPVIAEGLACNVP
ncbi:hypothetical protein [Novosphingobium sp. ZW T3_23]